MYNLVNPIDFFMILNLKKDIMTNSVDLNEI